MSTGIPRPRTASFSLHISTSASASSALSSFTPSSTTSSPSNLGRVPLDARVVLSKRRGGCVRYIGKLANEAGEWYGIALDEAKGEHDGRWQGVAYFQCAPHHGVFVRRKEIFYVKEQPSYAKSPPSPVLHDTSEEGDAPTEKTNGGSSDSGASVDSHDSVSASAQTAVSPLPTSALQRTFRSFHRVLQTPVKLGQSLLTGAGSLASPSSPTGGAKSASRRTPTRASMIPPPAITTTAKTRHQSIAYPTHHEFAHHMATTSSSPPAAATSPERTEPRIPSPRSSASLFDEADEFALLTRALAEQNNAMKSRGPLPLPPQIETGSMSSSTSRETSPVSSPQKTRPTTDRRHSTFAFGTPPSVASATVAASANAARVVELEKEIVTMRTNHENVVAVLRATNKQHAANVLELRAQVSALADGTTYLQRQLSLKSAQLQELKQNERSTAATQSELQSQLHERDATILQLEQEVAKLKNRVETIGREKENILIHMQREFQAKQQRDRETIQTLRTDVVSLVNARNASSAELQDARELSSFFL